MGYGRRLPEVPAASSISGVKTPAAVGIRMDRWHENHA